jgi:hypothetical protein
MHSDIFPATITSVCLLAVAPLTAIWAFFFFNERMTLLQWFGGGLIVVAVWVVSKTTDAHSTVERTQRSGSDEHLAGNLNIRERADRVYLNLVSDPSRNNAAIE